MNPREQEVVANLKFFKAAILDPVLEYQKYFERARFRIGLARPVPKWGFIGTEEKGNSFIDFGVFESVHWARLGVEIGYFEKDGTLKLISSAFERDAPLKPEFNRLSKAWSHLKDRRVITGDDDEWAKVIVPIGSGQAVVNQEVFSLAEGIAPAVQETLQSTFQTFLLLAAENIFDLESIYFLDSIGWTDNEEWKARRLGKVDRFFGSALAIGSGFASVWNYWDEMDSSSRFAVEKSFGVLKTLGGKAALNNIVRLKRYLDYANFLITKWGTSVDFAALLNPIDEVHKLIQDARAILSRRFNLGQSKVVDRYFELAGDFLNHARDDSPSWLESRLKLFDRLCFLITYAGGGASVQGRETHLWDVFTKGTENPLSH